MARADGGGKTCSKLLWKHPTLSQSSEFIIPSLGFTAQGLTLGHNSMSSTLLTLFLSKELSLSHIIRLVPREWNQKCHKNMCMFSPLHSVRWIDGKKGHRHLIQCRWHLTYFSLEAKIKLSVTSWTRVPLECTPQIFLPFQVTCNEADDKNATCREQLNSAVPCPSGFLCLLSPSLVFIFISVRR